jgi:hypothetical protein
VVASLIVFVLQVVDLLKHPMQALAEPDLHFVIVSVVAPVQALFPVTKCVGNLGSKKIQ